jgi:hypothetical protein
MAALCRSPRRTLLGGPALPLSQPLSPQVKPAAANQLPPTMLVEQHWQTRSR